MASAKQIAQVLSQEQPTFQDLIECRKEVTAPVRQRYDLAWLKKSLQAAVTLEFATIPPYLCALWSIKNNRDVVAVSIREVLQEEMLHMALTCNMLASIGGEPQIAKPAFVPQYPGKLPGGVHPELHVGLTRLSRESLEVFLEIERPHKVVEHDHGDDDDHEGPPLDGEQDTTIGEFYEEILEAFRQIEPDMSPDRQITGPLAWSAVRNLADVEWAINTISRQGEGSTEPFDSNPEDLAHYYRFLEIYEGRKLVWNEEAEILEHAGPLAFPDVWPMAPVPEGGYQREDVSPHVWYLLHTFDKTYTRLLNYLQQAWTRGGQAYFIRALETMFELEKYALPLMQIRTPFGGGETYGPCFRFLESEEVPAH